MNKAIVGRKLKMSQVFEADGVAVPVTVVEAGPCPVVQVKTVESGNNKYYDITNKFYKHLGFRELEVFRTLWDEWNPCQVYVVGIKEII